MSRSPRLRLRLPALCLALVAFGLIAAGCGSSSNSSNGGSTITIGAEPTGSVSTAAAATAATPTAAATSTAVATPKTGPLSKEPKVVPPKGPTPKKLLIIDLVPGTGAVATPSSTVTVNYVGVLYKGGKTFDSSWSRGQTATFPLTGVIPGWTQGLAGMKVGGRRELIIPASLGYGAAGSPPTIPPNAALVFVVDLLAVQ